MIGIDLVCPFEKGQFLPIPAMASSHPFNHLADLYGASSPQRCPICGSLNHKAVLTGTPTVIGISAPKHRCLDCRSFFLLADDEQGCATSKERHQVQ